MAVERRMPRVAEVILPHLRAQMPDVTFTTWGPDVDKRSWPWVNIRRLGGLPKDPKRLDRAVIEMTAYSRDGLVECENLYLDARWVIYDLWDRQIITPGVGYISSYFETMGPTQFDSPFDDSWRVQGLIQLGLRPSRHPSEDSS